MIAVGVWFRERSATRDQIFAHLQACDDSYLPPLSDRVDIGDYATKIFENAATFEAWNESGLVGMVAAYLNQADRSAFITSVSVERESRGQGIASKLLGQCLAKARSQGMANVALEVFRENASAIELYRKHGFSEHGADAGTVRMQLLLSEQPTP